MNEKHNASKKYIFIENYSNKNHAGSKATNDITKILLGNGYSPLYAFKFIPSHYDLASKKVTGCSSNKIISKIKTAIITLFSYVNIIFIYLKIKNNSTLFIQYPFIQLRIKPEWQNFIFSIFKKKNITIEVIIHDLDGLRQNNPRIEIRDIKLFYMCSKIICHNETMKNFLITSGVDNKNIRTINFFDYLHSADIIPEHKKDEPIAFCGNLKKAKFIKDLDICLKTKKINFYGIKDNNVKFPVCGKYMGLEDSFTLPSKIQGSWGLVWDGESIKSCENNFGEYLVINSPHKVSLYLVSRLPVIIWKESALAFLIEKYNLGITVNSLDEIENKINAVSEDGYQKIIESIEIWARKIENGEMILEELREIEKNETEMPGNQ